MTHPGYFDPADWDGHQRSLPSKDSDILEYWRKQPPASPFSDFIDDVKNPASEIPLSPYLPNTLDPSKWPTKYPGMNDPWDTMPATPAPWSDKEDDQRDADQLMKELLSDALKNKGANTAAPSEPRPLKLAAGRKVTVASPRPILSATDMTWIVGVGILSDLRGIWPDCPLSDAPWDFIDVCSPSGKTITIELVEYYSDQAAYRCEELNITVIISYPQEAVVRTLSHGFGNE